VHTHPDGTFCGAPVLHLPAIPGDRLWVRESLWVSDCGKYLARQPHIPNDVTRVLHDVVHRETRRWWLAGRYQPTGWDDTDRRYTHPEFNGVVVGWSNRGRRRRNGEWSQAFEQTFCDVDPSIAWRSGSSDAARAILSTYTATFRKHLPAIHMPRWASRIILEVVSVRVERLHAISTKDALAEGTEHWWNELSYKNAKGVGNVWTDLAVRHGWEKVAPDFRGAFGALWTQINGAAAWGRNPWVWRIEFRRVPDVSNG
jgi:hypothetical protein